MNDIRKVCVLGAGKMGCRIALLSGVHGYDAAVYDVSTEALQRGPEQQKMMAAPLVSQGVFSQSDVASGLRRVVFTSDANLAAENADLLSESIPEVLELKRKIHAQFDKLCPPKTIMTTNTSSLLVSEIEDVVLRGDKFAALHFSRVGSVVDIMRGPRTSPETVEILRRFALSLGETPIVLKKETDGYLCNTMTIALCQSALSLVIGGYADMEDVDRAWMAVRRSHVGPFGMLDNVGLDVILNIWEIQARRGRPGFKESADFIRPYVQRGDLGVKTGKGFYTYPDAAFMRPGFIKNIPR